MRTTDFAFGGYLITNTISIPSSTASLRRPEGVTASGCFASFFPDVCAFASLQRTLGCEEWMREFGLGEASSYRELCATLLDSGELLWARFIQSDAAVRKLMQVVSPTFEPIVLGLARHRDLVSQFIKEESIGTREEETVVGALRRSKPPPDSGIMLGFEPLGFEYGANDAHSWICHDLQRTFFEGTRASPNRYGLIEDFELARAFCGDVTNEELGEPVLWLPWALIDYSRAFGVRALQATGADRTSEGG